MKELSYKLDFESLIDHSLNAIFVLKENEIIYANKTVLQLLGFDHLSEVLHREFQQFLHPDFYKVCKTRLKRVREEFMIAEVMEQKMIRKDGTIIDIEVMAAPHSYQGNIFALLIVRDISRRKETEKRLLHAEKLSAIGEFSTGIAHEIKNPLTAVKGFIQLLRQDLPHPYLDIMDTKLDNALNTLTNMLQIAKLDLNLCHELESLLLLFQDQFYRVKVETTFIHTDQTIQGKRNILMKAFFNLIKNAFEAIEESGNILIEQRVIDTYVLVKITDTGKGIPTNDLNKLGTPFYSTKDEGTGMGLVQVFNTIHQHGGSIEVESQLRKGTCFSIRLPI
ncbi:ATP-binding protein [Robertmurraya korlensis]|uniref:ATP-binding protein n=1 Tax=Robertmurraya korlensis TaxID=519977 RepID=UPI000824B5C6|nr:ATP-binding protein [Robertmurraya korlensis]